MNAASSASDNLQFLPGMNTQFIETRYTETLVPEAKITFAHPTTVTNLRNPSIEPCSDIAHHLNSA
jgi:hypothetical protein